MNVLVTGCWSAGVFEKAWAFATRYHQGQTYGGPNEGEHVAYINHIASVAMEIMWAIQSDSTINGDLAIQCALLHDTIEDTAASSEIIKAEFGVAVADGVLALSKNSEIEPKDAQIMDSLQRIKLQPREIWMVKLADRIANLYHPPFYWNNEKILSYRDEAITIHAALHTANTNLANRLQEKIDQYPSFLRN